jgi:hypothetical protein
MTGCLPGALVIQDGAGAVRTFGYHRDSPAAARHFTADALACRRGVELLGNAGKTVWVELCIRPRGG